ncbi:MAG: 5'-methylthioadenosine/S-adenosylhomocysteine nucleosidase [Clostridiales bacterium]|nr:5'-methylthioadenosine/S-adenosylhomocysteine nucleosidase [Clostridiales bacterium]
MLGVICAMEVELSGLVALMENKEKVNIIGYEFIKGEIFGKKLVVALCGIGKANAAAVTALLISNFGVSELINLGVCGGSIGTGKTIVATSVVQYDFDTTAIGDELGKLDGFDSPYIKTSDISDGIACDARGVIASGDRFVSDKATVDFLTTHFGAIGFDMESGAVAQICTKANVKFAVLRVVSDGGDIGEYVNFKELAAKKGIDAVLNYLNN